MPEREQGQESSIRSPRIHFLKDLDYFFVLRPLILIPSWNFLLIGAYLARQERGLNFDLVLALMIYTCVMGGVYIVNQIIDRDTDRINRKLFIISEGHISLKAAYAELAILWTSALILSLKFGLVFLSLIVLSMLLGIMYSVTPFKFKSRPVLDMFANAFGYGLVNCLVGWLIFKPLDCSALVRFLPYVLSIAAVFINTTVVDIEGDKKTGSRTTAIFLGKRNSYILASLLMTGATLIAWFNKDLICLMPAIVSLPLFFYIMFANLVSDNASRRLTIASFRLPGLIFTLITGYIYPVYFIFVVLLFAGMRLYYRYRFNMEYPTLGGG